MRTSPNSVSDVRGAPAVDGSEGDLYGNERLCEELGV